MNNEVKTYVVWIERFGWANESTFSILYAGPVEADMIETVNEYASISPHFNVTVEVWIDGIQDSAKLIHES